MLSGVLAANTDASDNRSRERNEVIRFMITWGVDDSTMLQVTLSIFFFFHYFSSYRQTEKSTRFNGRWGNDEWERSHVV